MCHFDTAAFASSPKWTRRNEYMHDHPVWQQYGLFAEVSHLFQKYSQVFQSLFLAAIDLFVCYAFFRLFRLVITIKDHLQHHLYYTMHAWCFRQKRRTRGTKSSIGVGSNLTCSSCPFLFYQPISCLSLYFVNRLRSGIGSLICLSAVQFSIFVPSMLMLQYFSVFFFRMKRMTN